VRATLLSVSRGRASDDAATLTVPTAPVGERKLRLVVFISGGVVEFDLPVEGRIVVGRSSATQIHLDSTSVSREHAAIVAHGGSMMLHDLQSTNGTFVNNARLTESVAIGIGDVIRFGEIATEVRSVRESRLLVPRFVSGAELDARINEEAERCVRYDRSIAALCVEAETPSDSSSAKLRDVLLMSLRALDVATQRAPGCFQALVMECGKEMAVEVGERVRREASKRGIAARVGVSVFPGDVPSPESLMLAARLAMAGSSDADIGVASEGARILQIGNSEVIVAEPSMVRLFALVERVAVAPMSVLVNGETGTGKEIIAEALHVLGPRAGGPLVKINCAALPENLLESELFGHEPGAFSGAVGVKRGLFEEAHGGTLFLDEIGEMSPSLQAKLLRVLEDGVVRRIGATRGARFDVRIVAATHRDLRAAAAEGTFREDLFYRLGAMRVEIPPLRDRPREIPLLAERFVADSAQRAGKSPPSLRAETLAVLRHYGWPGNIRELRNVMGSATLLCEGAEVTLAHLPTELSEGEASEPPVAAPAAPASPVGHVPLMQEIRELEIRRITDALTACGGNRTKAAEMLGMPRRTLMYKIRGLEIDVPAPSQSVRGKPTLK
jgi:DNA-binding NtrC family response regulator